VRNGIQQELQWLAPIHKEMLPMNLVYHTKEHFFIEKVTHYMSLILVIDEFKCFLLINHRLGVTVASNIDSLSGIYVADDGITIYVAL